VDDGKIKQNPPISGVFHVDGMLQETLKMVKPPCSGFLIFVLNTSMHELIDE